MMSNSGSARAPSLRPLAGFWSTSGELKALYWGPVGSAVPPLPAGLRKPGRLVTLTSETFPGRLAPELVGWELTFAPPPPRPVPRRRSKSVIAPPTVVSSAPATAPTPASDHRALELVPSQYRHDAFAWTAQPTWILTPRVTAQESPEGWWAALDGLTKKSLFLVRIPPRRGKLPGPGWRNILLFVLKQASGAKLVPLTGLPSAEALANAVAWEYRVDAGPPDLEQATWDIQILPSRGLLSRWVGREVTAWEATAWLRWIDRTVPEPPPGEMTWTTLLTHLGAADARLLVHNVLVPWLPGTTALAQLFFTRSPDGKVRGRKELPLAWLSTLFPRRQWSEIEHASRTLVEDDQGRTELLEEIEAKLQGGSLEWSAPALALWEAGYRAPRREAALKELRALSASQDWSAWYGQSASVLETTLRSTDVTDLALVLATSPDLRWRRWVTKRRELEVREEMEFCNKWRQRGELTVERELDAWQSFLEETRKAAILSETP